MPVSQTGVKVLQKLVAAEKLLVGLLVEPVKALLVGRPPASATPS